jgi:Long-chain acyl-CoA synthetases (AMP-forming)
MHIKIKIGVSKEKNLHINSTEDCENNFDHIEGVEEYDFSKNRIQEDFSIVFSSGTSEKLKYIKRSFLDLTEKQKKKPSLLQKIKLFITIKRRGSIWTELKGKKNKIIIFLPFSHPMQRDFARICLGQNIDIVLSDPQNCIKHIMLEKPNIMISVPPLYDALAELIRSRVLKFNNEEKKKYEEYLKKGIYKRSNTNKKKQHYQNTLFKKIKKIYGGSADLFITGSAPIKKETLETFYKVGVKIYEAYGQSELGTTIMNNHKNFRIGSIGKPNKKIVKLGDNNEIL